MCCGNTPTLLHARARQHTGMAHLTIHQGKDAIFEVGHEVGHEVGVASAWCLNIWCLV